MKASFRSIVAVAGLCLASIALVNAADSQRAPVSERTPAFKHAPRDPVARTQKRLDNLSKKLNLTPAQQAAWANYSSAMLKLAQERAQEMEKRRSADRSKLGDMSAPERLENMATRMRAGAERLSKLASDTKTFYAELNPAQKTIFDLHAESARLRFMSMMHGRHH